MHATQFALTHTKTHTQTDRHLLVLLCVVVEHHSAPICLLLHLNTKGQCGNKNINCPLQRKVEIITFRQIRLVQLMSWWCFQFKYQRLSSHIIHEWFLHFFHSHLNKGQVCWPSISPLDSVFVQTLVYCTSTDLNMSNENKGRAKAEIHSHLRVPVIFHKTECHVLRVVHHYAW